MAMTDRETDQSGHEGREIDAETGTETTGHEWDGIKELDTPMPRWWVWTFYATIVFAIGYVIYYPAIPLLETSTAGISGITARGQLEKKILEVEEARADTLERIRITPLSKIVANEELRRFAVAAGRSNYKVYCTQCHGSGAKGGPGYPNLNDDDWLWGGDLQSIYTTIAHGVRNEVSENARFSLMPGFGEILEGKDIRAVSEYVLSLSGKEHNAERAEAGATVYAENCAACHGPKGLGGREFGAPNLADQLSLYGTSRELVRRQVRNPRHGVMPPWLSRLGEAQVKQLAVYVHSLGGGERDLVPEQAAAEGEATEAAKPE